jgi:phage repressor protein C with HTH and peptisase S24 domain
MNDIDIKNIREELGLTQSEFANRVGVALRTIQNWESGKIIPESKISLLRNIASKKNEYLHKRNNELKPKKFSAHISVHVVSSTARAGYSEAYYADEYLEDMPIVMIEADKEYHGKYLAFEVDGDSMEPKYNKGDIVICREVQRHLWRDRLHYKDWDFVIAHGTQGIMLKEITDHNTETGEIICHSINTDLHPDFTLNLREVAFLYNVVEHRIPGRKR